LKSASANCCVIIVTYNGKKWIEKCITSILQSKFPVDIIIVDNKSTDNTLDLIYSLCEPLKVIKSEENLGFGKANNAGVEYGYENGFDYFFLLNQDAYVQEDAIGHLIETLESSAGIGILSPIHLNGAGSTLDYGFKAGIKSKDLVSDYEADNWSRKLYDVRFVNAAAWMLSKASLKEVGLFHPIFFHYGEDKNYVSRVKHHGLKITIDRRAFICHDREKRGFNALKDDPFKNNDRETRQIILNPFNPAFKPYLQLKSLNNMNLVTWGWKWGDKLSFVKKAMQNFNQIWHEFIAFGSKDYYPDSWK
jgi:GT2 family glycosyltransferase